MTEKDNRKEIKKLLTMSELNNIRSGCNLNSDELDILAPGAMRDRNIKLKLLSHIEVLHQKLKDKAEAA